ncbi:hypothetical protein P4S95_16315 [Aneurinibacillus aneurinilyticus]|uniref:hypothetical protein n=1 Tax=Aneurinibacillus aneurinilyticus TaxID=1391 RepID=UPI002E24BB2E|nr:hypothetical protein [Aneurinibacillus aneurinilyticus]
MTDQELKEIQKRLDRIKTKQDIQRFGSKEQMVYIIQKLVKEINRKRFEMGELLDEVDELNKLVDKFSDANRELRMAITNQE